MCLRLVMHRLKRFKLYEYNSQNPIIFVQAQDPDDACHKALYNLINTVFKQDMSKKTINLLAEISNDIKVLKITIPKDKQ